MNLLLGEKNIKLDLNQKKVSPLVSINNVKKHYVNKVSLLEKWLGKEEDKVVHAVDGVNLNIFPGETLGIVGESGCGKSSLGRTILRLHDATEGEVLYNNENIFDYNPKQMKDFKKKAQIIFQNPYASLNPRKTVRSILSIALLNRGINDLHQQEEEMMKLVNRVGLSYRHLDNYPHQFSGGQRQRIGIGRALAMQPEFIVADEPVSALDVSVQAQIINLLEELQEELNLTYLFIAHDLSVVNYISDRVAVMYLGKIVEIGKTEDLFKNPLHPYTRALLSAVPSLDKKQRRERILLKGSVPTPLNPPSGCRFHTRCPVKIGRICEEVNPEWTERGNQGVACHLHE
ncbi:ABC transporter ATP-binding protein [Paenisporosarcina sp. TG-14]|uniref:ABC transporter ATP-binding protein n=1 Tax=Paenisporosarcina sp. TG-14 TaxID=1231057 RepID=UPI0002FF39FC|nr:oligopeptide/dipeptide ABC transporter ATP-binding protein [Paenisporosarcina sp. TG-14]